MTDCDACGFYARDDCPRNQHTCCMNCAEECYTDTSVGPASVTVALLCPCGGACHEPGDLCDADCCDASDLDECQPGCESCVWAAAEADNAYPKFTDCDGSESCACFD